MFYARPAQLR